MDDGGPEPQTTSPTGIADPRLRFEARKALIWVSVVALIGIAIYVAQALLVIFGGLVFAAIIDGGARLLNRVLPIGRGWRVAIVLLLAIIFVGWVVVFAGNSLTEEAAQFPALVEQQAMRLMNWLQSQGIEVGAERITGFAEQAVGGIGKLTSAVGGLIGGVTTLFLIVIIGVYVAFEPNLYERGVAWMVPNNRRGAFLELCGEMGYSLRRLMFGRIVGMVFEGLLTWAALAAYGVPLAVLLGLLTGLLAFIPNIGAVISGLLMVLVGFSGGTDMALYCVGVYLVVQTFDGYVVIPMIARKTVDLAPALVLASQLILGVLFGILGLALADPLIAMIKVMLEYRSEHSSDDQYGDKEAGRSFQPG